MRRIRSPKFDHDPNAFWRKLSSPKVWLPGLILLAFACVFGIFSFFGEEPPKREKAHKPSLAVAATAPKDVEQSEDYGLEPVPAPKSELPPEAKADEPGPLPTYDELYAKRRAKAEKSAPEAGKGQQNAQAASGIELQGTVQLGETMAASLKRAGLAPVAIRAITQALKDVFDFKKCREGHTWEARFNAVDELAAFTYHTQALESYYVRREGAGFRGYKIIGETEMFVVPVAGRIESSLSNAMWKLGETDQLTQLIADIFAWDIDFFSDLQKGDEFRAMVEKHYYKGKFQRYGRILCASFRGATIGSKYAYYFQAQGADSPYFDEAGNSLMKSFLRAPLDTLKVTSSFGFRTNPISGNGGMHNGVDYGAPIGTPAWAIASGTVVGAGWMGDCGNGVKIKHDNGYTSVYCHFSSVSVHVGETVHQKEMVGRVGTTGASTGPHLHFGLQKEGKFVNPLKVKYEPGKPIPLASRDRFKEARALLKEKLNAIEVIPFHGPELPADYVDPTAGQVSATGPQTPVAPLGGFGAGLEKGETQAPLEKSTASASPQKTSTPGKKADKGRKKATYKGYRPRPQGIHRAR